MLTDRYGLPVSTASPNALEAYVEGADRLLSANAGFDESFDRAIDADPALALAHAGRSRGLLLQGRVADARKAAGRARELAAGLTRRERGHVEALAIVADGDAPRALAAIREHLAEFPRDAMVLSPATGVYGLIGFSGQLDRNDELAALLDGLAGVYGDDWWFLGAHGFALTEARGWAAGAPLIARSLALAPRNAHGAHAWAHVLYERGADAEGAAFVEAWLPGYAREAQLHGHISWHWALFELARGRAERVAELYRDAVGPGGSLSPAMPLLADAASLLWRSELRGDGRRTADWSAVAAHAARSFPNVGMAFADAHCAAAYAAAGEAEALDRWIAELYRADREGRLRAGSVMPAVAEAFRSFSRGDWDGAIRHLAPMAPELVRVGGSRAQRDLFEHTLVAAYQRAGRAAEAAAFLKQRLDRTPSVPVA